MASETELPMQAERNADPAPDYIAEAAEEVRRLIEEGTPAEEVRWGAAVLCARFCGQIVNGELVMDGAKARRFGRLLVRGEFYRNTPSESIRGKDLYQIGVTLGLIEEVTDEGVST
jgi:hypothetical protein